MHRLVITGSMCSGKTTLLRSFAANANVACIEDEARRYLQEHPRVDRKSLGASRAIIQAYQAALAQAEKAGAATVSISDGSVLNPIAHMRAWGHPEIAERLLPGILPLIKSVTMFFLMDIDDIPYVMDEIRTENTQFRQELQQTYLQLFDELALPHQSVSGAGSIRHQRVGAYIASLSTS